jgi:pimeloyl-ACP methyl ester carboxylesterase
MPFKAQTIEVNGATIAMKRGGNGPPLLYLHGTEGLTEWPELPDRLALQYDVIAPDLPGFGNSPIPEWIDDVSDAAYFYLDVLEQLDLTDVRIVGHSLGAWIGMEMAIRSVERLNSLVIIAAAGIHVKGVPKADIYMIDPEEQARLAYADIALGEAAAQRATASKYQESAILNRIASARFGWSPRLYNPRLERWLHRIKIPTLVVWGDEDRIIPLPYAHAFRGAIPSSHLIVIKKAGHMPHIEQCAEVTSLIQQHLA